MIQVQLDIPYWHKPAWMVFFEGFDPIMSKYHIWRECKETLVCYIVSRKEIH